MFQWYLWILKKFSISWMIKIFVYYYVLNCFIFHVIGHLFPFFFLEKVANFRKEIQEEETLSKNIKSKKKWRIEVVRSVNPHHYTTVCILGSSLCQLLRSAEYACSLSVIFLCFLFRFPGEINSLSTWTEILLTSLYCDHGKLAL
jgi:hypothetical protein